MSRFHFRFTVLGRYPARVRGNKTAVTVSMASGEEDHVVHAGTLTMAEDEWDEFARALRGSLQGSVEIEDHGESA